ncbi:response regulator transcription factor [Phyllobacterium sp. SB3]|uniref:response regulator transcription factor n=1 Tax=Phyllobacterium sp. SB3 TaxID=3156073 RepID=UPI0032AFC41F
MRLLLVEDDPILGSSLKRAFERHAYGVDWYRDGEAGLAALETFVFSVVVLDINLPKINGLKILQTARQGGNKVPVLLLTALDGTPHKVDGLDSGADDYLVKPFDLNELLARVRALVRRSEGRSDGTLKCHDVELDPAALVVYKLGTQIPMTAQEFKMLKLLMERAGKYVTKSDIEYALYDATRIIESNTIEVIIYSLRKKLGSSFIHSMRGVGYMVEK